MQAAQKPQFVKMLASTLGMYGKPLPESSLLTAWWDCLESFPLEVVAAALSAYCDQEAAFAPIPAGIRKRCKEFDGRPGAEEAWAISLTSRDEAETVVWTQEAAQAFSICMPVLDSGDEVGARMAFKEAYQRLVSASRATNERAVWVASLGWDLTRRSAALAKSVTAGLLSAPVVAALLPPPASSGSDDAGARAQIAKIKTMMAAMQAESEQAYALSVARDRNATAEAKAKANAAVAQYKRDEAA